MAIVQVCRPVRFKTYPEDNERFNKRFGQKSLLNSRSIQGRQGIASDATKRDHPRSLLKISWIKKISFLLEPALSIQEFILLLKSGDA